MLLIVLFLSVIFFLIGSFCLVSISTAFRVLPKKDMEKQLNALGNLFYYTKFHNWFFPKFQYEGTYFATICATNLTRILYAGSAILFLLNTRLGSPQTFESGFSWFWMVMSVIALILLSFVVGDYLPRLVGTRAPISGMRLSTPFASFFLFLVFPITYIFLKVSASLSRDIYFDHINEPGLQAKKEIIEMIHQATLSPTLDPHDKKLIESVLSFQTKVTREVMVPRVDVFSLPAETPIRKAAKQLQEEGYSRTPVYRGSVDEIIGVLMYKDILGVYMENVEKNDPDILAAPIETIIKPALYIPETKPISFLLQEFKKKQVHFAIVVDEYGGTEGIITIEDILEEIVGEIEDEYDVDDESLFIPLPDGSWVIDARMNIADVEEELGIKIPQEAEYDTIAGFIFHRTGTIPSRKFVIKQDEFELEVLRSNDRSVEKVRLKPLLLPSTEEDEERNEDG